MPLATPPLSLYVHFPWCVRKCPYCDFNSYALNGALPEKDYLAALERDLQAQASKVSGRALVSVFFGGGTPSLFTPSAIGRVLAMTRQHFTMGNSVEVTLEANPGTIERGRFAEYAAAGVNRVSLGAQSFDAEALKALGRIHSPDDTRRAVDELLRANLSNFNLDLMYALPGQTIRGALGDLTQALDLKPAHLSHYQLTLEPGTVFAARPPPLPDEDAAAEMLNVCRERLQDAGFAHYEVSAYARGRHCCRHNLNYWQFGDYLGVGAGAHGKLTDAGAGLIVRTTQTRDPRRYLAAPPGALAQKTIAAADLPFEFMLNALRLIDGFDLETFTARTGLPADSVAEPMLRLIARGFIESDGLRHRPTAQGLSFLNDVLLEFLPVPGANIPVAEPFFGLSTGH